MNRTARSLLGLRKKSSVLTSLDCFCSVAHSGMGFANYAWRRQALHRDTWRQNRRQGEWKEEKVSPTPRQMTSKQKTGRKKTEKLALHRNTWCEKETGRREARHRNAWRKRKKENREKERGKVSIKPKHIMSTKKTGRNERVNVGPTFRHITWEKEDREKEKRKSKPYTETHVVKKRRHGERKEEK